MTFAEFAMACGGFEDFHAAPSDKKAPGTINADAHYRAMGML